MAACIMGHGDAGYCEHCPGDGGQSGGNKRPSLESLRVELLDAYEGEGNTSRVTFAEWLEAMGGNPRGTLQDAANEYLRGAFGYDMVCEVPGSARLALVVGSHSDRRETTLAGVPRGWESLDDNRDVCGAYVFGECICGDVLPIADEMDESREELRVLDASLSLDAVACAEGAVHGFAESIETDVRYALTQIRRVMGVQTPVGRTDAAQRALDALERVEGRIAGVTCEDAVV